MWHSFVTLVHIQSLEPNFLSSQYVRPNLGELSGSPCNGHPMDQSSTHRSVGTFPIFYGWVIAILIFCGLVALPYLLTNTVVLTWLIELAALDRVGVTPSEVSPLDLVRINEESAIRSIVR